MAKQNTKATAKQNTKATAKTKPDPTPKVEQGTEDETTPLPSPAGTEPVTPSTEPATPSTEPVTPSTDDVASPAEDETPVKLVTISARGLALREKPSKQSAMLAVLTAGTALTVRTDDEQAEGWYPVITRDGKAGWVDGRFIAVVE